MIYKAKCGQVSYGETVGILLLDCFTAFIPGDVANASTYNFPVRFKKVKDYTVKKAIEKDAGIFDNLLEAASDLERSGVRAITGNCGYMGIHQKKLADCMNVPVFLSSLMQVPFISNMIGDDKKVGIISADSRGIDSALLEAVGITDNSKLEIRGLEDRAGFYSAVIEQSGTLDSEKIEREVILTARKMVKEIPSVAALLLECSCLPPYSAAVQQSVGLPVFDYITMINYVHSSVVRSGFSGFM